MLLMWFIGFYNRYLILSTTGLVTLNRNRKCPSITSTFHLPQNTLLLTLRKSVKFRIQTKALKFSQCCFKNIFQKILYYIKNTLYFLSYSLLVARTANSAADIGFCWTLYSWYRPLLPFTICLIGAGIVEPILSYPALRGVHSFGGITYTTSRKVRHIYMIYTLAVLVVV